MPDASMLIKQIQKIALNTYLALQPCDFLTGEVISTSPLKVQIEQKLELTEEFLTLPASLSDHVIEVSALPEEDPPVKKKYKVYNGLKTGDIVILIRQSGGQQYLILDRMGGIT